MSFLKEPNGSFPHQERRHCAPDEAPRAARSTLGPGMVPADAEPDPWGHHVSRGHFAHTGNYAVLPPPAATAQVSGSPAPEVDPNFTSDVRWQSNYQAQTAQEADLGDDVGKPTRRRGKKMMAPQPGLTLQSPFSSPARSTMILGSEAAIHDGTSKNSAHIPGYTGHISAASPEYCSDSLSCCERGVDCAPCCPCPFRTWTQPVQLANKVSSRTAHDKSLFAENYASMMNKMGGRL